MIRAGKSDRQILASFIARYGERILAEPEGIKQVVLTAVPIVALLIGCAALILFFIAPSTGGDDDAARIGERSPRI